MPSPASPGDVASAVAQCGGAKPPSPGSRATRQPALVSVCRACPRTEAESSLREQSEAGVFPAHLSPSAVGELRVYPQASQGLFRLPRQGSNLRLGSLSLRPQNFCAGHEEGSNKLL